MGLFCVVPSFSVVSSWSILTSPLPVRPAVAPTFMTDLTFDNDRACQQAELLGGTGVSNIITRVQKYHNHNGNGNNANGKDKDNNIFNKFFLVNVSYIESRTDRDKSEKLATD